MSSFDMFCPMLARLKYICIITTRRAGNGVTFLIFSRGFGAPRLKLDERRNVNDQKETRKSSNFDYRFVTLE